MNAHLSFRRLFPGFTVALAAGLGAGALAAAAAEIEVVEPPAPGLVDLRYAGQRVMLYAAGTNQFKPYVKELYALSGVNVLVDSPPDHVHHHGLMYAITVNGANFWEEQDTPGYQVQVTRPRVRIVQGRGGPPQAVLTQRLHWVANAGVRGGDSLAAALLVEDRALTLTVDAKNREVALDWQGSFTLGPNTPKVVLTGTPYHGLGVRLPRAFDRVARHQNGAGLPYSVEQKGDVLAARWSCSSHVLDGTPLAIAVFSDPANAGESKFFTMLDAFAYVSATQGLDKAALQYQQGADFRIRYLVTVSAEDQKREAIEQRYQQWTRSRSPR